MSPGLSENGFIVTVRPVIPEEKGPSAALQGRGTQISSVLASPYSCGSCLLRPANAPEVRHPPSLRSWRLSSSLPWPRAATLSRGLGGRPRVTLSSQRRGDAGGSSRCTPRGPSVSNLAH